MKKITSLALAILLMLTAAGCGTSNAPAQSSSAAGSTSAAPASEAPAPEDAQPEGYPAKTIDWLVPVNAGAAVDLHVRALDNAVSLGGNTSVTNMAGANQTLGITEAYHRPADGYTIVSSAFAGLVIQPNTIETEYSQADFRHIAALNEPAVNCIVAAPGSDVDTWDALKAKLDSGETVYFTAANAGAVGHLAFLSIMDQLGINNAEFVSYNGTAETATAVMGGHVDVAVLDIGVATNYIKDGTLTNVLTLSDERSPLLPDSVCAGEEGITGMDNFAGFLWIAVAKDTPEEIVSWLKTQINETLAGEEYQTFLATQNETMDHIYTEEELTARLKEASDMYANIISKYIK